MSKSPLSAQTRSLDLKLTERRTRGNIFDTTHYGSDTTPGGAGFRDKAGIRLGVYEVLALHQGVPQGLEL